VRSIPPIFFVMAVFSNQLISAGAFFVLVFTAFSDTAPEGSVEGHLKIVSSREVELADGTPSPTTAENYSDYPLVILSGDQKTEIARVTADENGNYRVALPPGDYILDVKDRRRRHVRATPQPFTVASNQTVHVDMNIDTGIR
jgi:hypothetical protein